MLTFIRCMIVVMFFFLILGCASKEMRDDGPPPTDLPTVPNCAADGPDCKQFNPELKN